MPMVLSAALFAATAASSLKVYHVNPVSAGVIPSNMDTGDAPGDLYFYLGQFLLPVECEHFVNSTTPGFNPQKFDCGNPERRDPSLVVTEVDLEVKDEAYTAYSACNLCNGTDPISHLPCELGSYICDCQNYSSGGACEPAKVGAENVTTNFVHTVPAQCKAGLEKYCPFQAGTTDGKPCEDCFQRHSKVLEGEYNCSTYEYYFYCPTPWSCSPTNPDWTCWRDNIVRKTGGMWYSTLADGQCNGKNDATCTWTVQAAKTVNETCMHASIVDAVEDNAPACFQGCGQPRNESSPCWIGCFYDSVLGPDARNHSDRSLAGMPFPKIEAAWTGAFNGGCPLIPATSA